MIIRKLAVIVLLILSGCSKIFLFDEERKAVEALCNSYNSVNWEIRREAISHICQSDVPCVENTLIAALDDIHHGVRIEALKCVGEMKSLKAIRTVRYMAEYESDNNVKLYAVIALAKYRDPYSAPVFANGLLSNDWFIREESIKGLLMINDLLIQKTSIPYVLKALDDERINVKLTTLENLKIKDERIFKVLSAIVSSPENNKKINLLKSTLKALNGYLLDEKTRGQVIGLLTHTDTNVRILALAVLKKDKEFQDKEMMKKW